MYALLLVGAYIRMQSPEEDPPHGVPQDPTLEFLLDTLGTLLHSSHPGWEGFKVIS